MEAESWIHDDEAEEVRDSLRPRYRFAGWVLLIGALVAIAHMSAAANHLPQASWLLALEVLVLVYGGILAFSTLYRSYLLNTALGEQELQLENEADKVAENFQKMLNGGNHES